MNHSFIESNKNIKNHRTTIHLSKRLSDEKIIEKKDKKKKTGKVTKSRVRDDNVIGAISSPINYV